MRWNSVGFRAAAITATILFSIMGLAQSSACKANDLSKGCYGPFTGMQVNDPTLGTITLNLPGTADVSGVSIHSLIPGKGIFVHLQPWFWVGNQTTLSYPVPNGSGGYVSINGHIETGYKSSDLNLVDAQLADIQRRGFDGLVIDWYGPNATANEIALGAGALEDNTAQQISNRILNAFTSLRFALVEDEQAWLRDYTALGYTPVAGCLQNNISQPPADQTACIQQHLSNDLQYIKSSYLAGNPGYLLATASGPSSSGLPVLQFFGDESTWTANFSQVWASANGTITNFPPAQRPALIFLGDGGFGHLYTSGAFAWPLFPGPTTPDPNGDFNNNKLLEFYNAASQHPDTLQAWGAVFKGFDDRQGGFGQHSRYIHQKCGQWWMNTVGLANAHYGSQPFTVPFVVIPTWNDYDEGSEIESGIDNCVDESSAIATGGSDANGSNLTFSFQFNSPDGTRATIDHYELLAAPLGSGNYLNYGPALVSGPNCATGTSQVSCTIHPDNYLPRNGNLYTLQIKEVSKNSLANHLFNLGYRWTTPSGDVGDHCALDLDCQTGLFCNSWFVCDISLGSCSENNGCSERGAEEVDYCTYPETGCDNPWYRNVGGCCEYQYSPIVIDLSGDGFHLTTAADGVWFDLLGRGEDTKVSWTAPMARNAWLVLDRNENGRIDNGKELFGNLTDQPQSSAPNGFLALAQFDKPELGGNGDAVIDARDSVFSRLRLWIDLNHNGISEPEELFTLESQGITAIDLNYQEKKWTDENGNRFRYRARVFGPAQGQTGNWAYDVFLVSGSGSRVPASFPLL